jgi:hypothetical protein
VSWRNLMEVGPLKGGVEKCLLKREYLNTYVMPTRKRRRRLTLEDKERIIAYRREGHTYTEISLLMGGLPLSTIERYISGRRKPPKPLPEKIPPEITVDPTGYSWERMPVENTVMLGEALKGEYSTLDEMVDALIRAVGPASDTVKKSVREYAAAMWMAGLGRKSPGPINWMEFVKQSIQLNATHKSAVSWVDTFLVLMMGKITDRFDGIDASLMILGGKLNAIEIELNSLRSR